MVDITTVTAFLIDGLARGAVWALLGLTITLVFGLGEVLNLTVGVFAVIGAIATATLLGSLSTLLIAIPAGLVVVVAVGGVLDRSIISFVYRSEGEERILVGIFVTLGVALMFEGLLFIYYPSSYSLSLGLAPITVGDLLIRGSSVAVITLSLLLFVGLYGFFTHTYLGQATRTVIQDERGAILCGINPRRIQSLIFLLSLLIAGLAGIFYSFTFQIRATDALLLSIYAVIVSIVGGVRSIVGTVMAGLVLGVIVTYANAYIGSYVAQVVLFAVVALVLIARPEQIT